MNLRKIKKVHFSRRGSILYFLLVLSWATFLLPVLLPSTPFFSSSILLYSQMLYSAAKLFLSPHWVIEFFQLPFPSDFGISVVMGLYISLVSPSIHNPSNPFPMDMPTVATGQNRNDRRAFLIGKLLSSLSSLNSPSGLFAAGYQTIHWKFQPLWGLG